MQRKWIKLSSPDIYFKHCIFKIDLNFVSIKRIPEQYDHVWAHVT